MPKFFAPTLSPARLLLKLESMVLEISEKKHSLHDVLPKRLSRPYLLIPHEMCKPPNLFEIVFLFDTYSIKPMLQTIWVNSRGECSTIRMMKEHIGPPNSLYMDHRHQQSICFVPQ